MSRLIAVDYMSLDGVIQAPGHVAEDQDGGFEDGGDLVDEYQLWLHPVVLGGGKRLAGAALIAATLVTLAVGLIKTA